MIEGILEVLAYIGWVALAYFVVYGVVKACCLY